MPKPEEDLIDRLTLRPEVREKARALLRAARSKTGPGTGYDIGDAKSGLPAICTYIASKSANYADVTQEVAQKASCLAPKTFSSTLRTVKTALLASNKTPNGSPNKAGGDADPMAYATLIGEYKIGQPRRVEKWMKEAQAALVALPRFRHDFASRITESGTEVRIVVFFWVCRAIKLSTVQQIPLADKYGVSLKVFNRLQKMMDDECVDLMESIRTTIKEMRKKKAKVEVEVEVHAPAHTSASQKTPVSTPSHSRSASPTKSAMRDATLTPSLTTNSAAKRKVAFTLSDMVSASEDDEGVSAPPETPSKRPRRAYASATARVMPRSKAELASATSSEGEKGAVATAADEDIEMSDATVPPSPSPVPTPRPLPRLVAASTPPVAGPSTPRRRPMTTTTPTHAYRTPPSARIRLLSDDEDEAAEAAMVGDYAEHAVASEDADGDGGGGGGGGDDDDALPPSRRFRPVFLDRAQWAQRAPRLAHDRAAAERRTRELVGRWGYPFEMLRRASTLAKAPAG